MQIGIWGDSITYGGPQEGWVGKLREVIGPKKVKVYNRGICGDTSADILKRFDIEAKAIKPDIVIIVVGVNDSKYPIGSDHQKVPFEEYCKNISELFGKAKAIAQRVIFIGLTEVNEAGIGRGHSRFSDLEIKRYSDYLKTFSKKEKIDFVEMIGVLDTNTDFEDGIHPNSSGYSKMFAAILPIFK